MHQSLRHGCLDEKDGVAKRRRFLLNLALLLAGLASASSGLTLQSKYHIGRHGPLDLVDWAYPLWPQFHKFVSVMFLTLVAWHLMVNWKWLRAMWNKGRLHQDRQLVTLSLMFVAAVLTGLGAWDPRSSSWFTPCRRGGMGAPRCYRADELLRLGLQLGPLQNSLRRSPGPVRAAMPEKLSRVFGKLDNGVVPWVRH
jgi:hypothetical protein